MSIDSGAVFYFLDSDTVKCCLRFTRTSGALDTKTALLAKLDESRERQSIVRETRSDHDDAGTAAITATAQWGGGEEQATTPSPCSRHARVTKAVARQGEFR
jgi:hypothetical protein